MKVINQVLEAILGKDHKEPHEQVRKVFSIWLY